MMHDVEPTERKLNCCSPPSEEVQASIVPYKKIFKALLVPTRSTFNTERIGAFYYVAFFLVFLMLMWLSAQGHLPVIRIERSFTHETLIHDTEAMQKKMIFPIVFCFIYLPIIFGNTACFYLFLLILIYEFIAF